MRYDRLWAFLGCLKLVCGVGVEEEGEDAVECSVEFEVVGFEEEGVSDSKKLCMVGVYCG